MASIWEPKNKFKIWLKIEVLACEALAKRGEIPKSALKDIQEKSDFKVERIDEINSISYKNLLFVGDKKSLKIVKSSLFV